MYININNIGRKVRGFKLELEFDYNAIVMTHNRHNY